MKYEYIICKRNGHLGSICNGHLGSISAHGKVLIETHDFIQNCQFISYTYVPGQAIVNTSEEDKEVGQI